MAILEIKEKVKNDWIRQGNVYFPCDGKISVTDSITPGIWKVICDNDGMNSRIGMIRISDKFDLGVEKLYNVGGDEIIELISKTWANPSFKKQGKNLCAIFRGLKGTGKTISSKILCNKYCKQYPIIVLDNAFDGCTHFIQNLDFECVVLIDEAEKTFSEGNSIDLLKICDGVYNKAPKIVLMTLNEMKIDPNLISRPGRVRYVAEFSNLPENTLREYLKDNLDSEEAREEIFDLVNSLSISTIDILKNIIDEYKIHNSLDSVLKFMNIPYSYYNYKMLILPEVTRPEEYEYVRAAMYPVLRKKVPVYDWWTDSYSDNNEWHNIYLNGYLNLPPCLNEGSPDLVDYSEKDLEALRQKLNKGITSYFQKSKSQRDKLGNTFVVDSSYISNEWGGEMTNVVSLAKEIKKGTLISPLGVVITEPNEDGFFWVEVTYDQLNKHKEIVNKSDFHIKNFADQFCAGDKILCYLAYGLRENLKYGTYSPIEGSSVLPFIV